MLRKIPLITDLLFACVLLPALCFLLPIERWMANNLTFVCILVCWLYIVYFFNRYVTVPMFFQSRRRGFTALILILATILITWFIAQYQMEFPHRPVRPRRVRAVARARLHQQAVWFLYVTTIAFSTAVGLLTELIRQIVRSHDLETEKKKAELALYKAQINPHFLFNTLNTLYGMIVMKSQQVETAFMQFIGLMKYMYTNPTKESIPVEEEIDYIRQYIEIQKYRTENKDSIQLSYYNDNKRQGLQIVPMLLITFVENAIKYGLSSTDDRQVYIVIRIEDGTLFFSTQNQKPTDRRGNSAGIGISNCRKRLELAYPKRHKLEINDADGLYTVLLSITLTN